MVAITAVCLVLLCVLLFLMGIEIGKLLAPTPAPVSTAVAVPAPMPSSSPSPAPAPAAPTQ